MKTAIHLVFRSGHERNINFSGTFEDFCRRLDECGKSQAKGHFFASESDEFIFQIEDMIDCYTSKSNG